jgi:hypothetical protein
MALTQGNWVTSSSNGVKIIKCTVTATVSENDAYTLRTPKTLDPTRPWTLIANAAGTTLDGSASGVDLWIGTSDDAVLSGDETVAGTDAYEFKTIEAQVQSSVGVVICDPNLAIADVTDQLVRVPIAPCYIFNLDGGSTLNAADCIWIIIQEEGDNSPLDTKYDVSGVGVDPS